MQWILMYVVMAYIVACADDIGTKTHRKGQRIGRILLWPLTVTSWFRSQCVQLHRLLNILWCVLIGGWFLSLIADRL